MKAWPKTIEEQLAVMRGGAAARLQLKVGEIEIPVRLLTAAEEAQTILQAKVNARKSIPVEGLDPKVFESLEVMKEVLLRAGTVDETPYLSRGFLDKLTERELDVLYDRYLTLKSAVNPEFEKLTDAEVSELVESVKKKELAPSTLPSWQLAAIGKRFLEAVRLQASAPML